MMEHNEHHNCGRKPRRMEKFMEACLLCLLSEETSHGYRLMEKLAAFGFTEADIDISSLYRTLRNMEDSGVISSSWEESGQGPNRRNYSITDSGKRELDYRAARLRTRREYIDALISRYEAVISSERK